MEPTKDTDFVQALGRIPSGLFIVTAANGDERAAFLGSFVQQISFEPLLFTVACHPERYPYKLISKSQKFGLSILPENDKVLVKKFAKGHGPEEDLLASVSMTVIDGIPLLKDALGAAVFEVVSEEQPGDHVLFIGKAVNGVLFDGDLQPWVHVRSSALNY